MKVLITGAGGFVGSTLADFMMARGDSVAAVDAVPWQPNNYLWPHRNNLKFNYYCDSVLNDGLMRYLIRECDTVYHLAAAVGLENVIGQVLKVIETNVHGTEVVLRLASEYHKRVLFTSTSEIAGKSPNVPFKETDDRLLGPTSVDRWVYSETKALGEYMCLGYHRAGLPVSVVRLFNVYGPRLDREGSGRVVSRFLRQAMNNETITVIGDGRQTRCYTYISDIVRGIVAACEVEEAAGGIFNLGTTDEVSINELVKIVAETTGRNLDVKHVGLDDVYGPGYEDIPRRVPDAERARKILGFKAEIPLRSGMQETYKWLESCISTESSQLTE